MNLEEKQLSKEYLFNGKVIRLRKDIALLPNGNTAVREVVEHNGGVCVVALTDNDEVIMVRQFRYPYSEVVLEIPAGKRDSVNEDPLECGKRELKEETGAEAEVFIPLGELYPTPGYCGEIIWMYAARISSFGEDCPDNDEFLTIEKIPLETAVEMILSGKIKDAKTQAAILKVKLLKDSGKI